jgi:hypothetical protein
MISANSAIESQNCKSVAVIFAVVTWFRRDYWQWILRAAFWITGQ